jgi:hypothetical protein
VYVGRTVKLTAIIRNLSNNMTVQNLGYYFTLPTTGVTLLKTSTSPPMNKFTSFSWDGEHAEWDRFNLGPRGKRAVRLTLRVNATYDTNIPLHLEGTLKQFGPPTCDVTPCTDADNISTVSLGKHHLQILRNESMEYPLLQ